MPTEGKMLELVQYLLHHTDLTDDALIEEAQRMVNSGEYTLNGIFADSKFEH